MSNRKFNLDNEVQPEIHFRLLSISASKFENDWTSFPHSHHFTEIFFIKDGTGRMLIENESLPVSSNSLVVIGAQVTHTEFSDPENPLDYYVLRCYRSIYAGAMMDIKDIEGKTTDKADLFVCKVMTALGMQYMVDACGDAPYTEMCQGNANPTPKWDDGQTVYTDVLNAMDEAESAIPETATMITMTDPMFNQNLDAWKRFANGLRLRMYMRLIDAGVDVANYTAKAKAIVASGELPKSDVTFDVYSNAEGQYNPWYASYFALSTNNFCAAYPIVSYYNATDDPRIGYAMDVASATDTYVGQIPGSKTLYKGWSGKDWKNKNVSTIKVAQAMSMPIYLMTLSEVEFLKAEVELRFNDDAAAAKVAYEAAVKADFTSRGITGADAFLAGVRVNFDDQATKEAKLKLIYMQKWTAFFFRNHMEAWSEQRRTDVPALSEATAQDVYNGSTKYSAGDLINPGLNYYGKGNVCKRMPYPDNARKYNKNTPAPRLIDHRQLVMEL